VVGARVKLDPACSQLDASRCLGDRTIVGVETAERNESAPRGSSLGEDHVVRLPVAPRLVHGKDDAARVERGEDLEQLLAREARAVRIVRADVRVGVEQGDPGQIGEQGLKPRLQQRFVDRGSQTASLVSARTPPWQLLG